MTTPPASSTENSANPLLSAASSLIKLDHPASPQGSQAVENRLADEAHKVERGDLSGVEAMLSHQAQLLHRIFAQAVERYAESDMPEKSRLYGNIALKAQSYCRQTVSTLAHMKDHLKEERIIRQMEVIHRKPTNELLSGGPHEALDTRRETAPVTIDPWLAALENGGS